MAATGKSPNRRQSRLLGNDAQRESYGKIAQSNGDAVAKTLNDISLSHNRFQGAKLHFSIKTAKQITKNAKNACFAVKFQTVYLQNQVTLS